MVFICWILLMTFRGDNLLCRSLHEIKTGVGCFKRNTNPTSAQTDTKMHRFSLFGGNLVDLHEHYANVFLSTKPIRYCQASNFGPCCQRLNYFLCQTRCMASEPLDPVCSDYQCLCWVLGHNNTTSFSLKKSEKLALSPETFTATYHHTRTPLAAPPPAGATKLHNAPEAQSAQSAPSASAGRRRRRSMVWAKLVAMWRVSVPGPSGW